MLHQYFSITGSADTTGEEGKLEDDLAEDPAALAAAAAHASHTDLTALESTGTGEGGRLINSKGAYNKAITSSDLTSFKTATNHTNTVANSSGRDRIMSLFYTPKTSVKDGSNGKPSKSSSTHDLAATDTTATNIRRSGSLLGTSNQPMTGGDNSDTSTALTTTTNTNHAAVSVKENKKKQEGIYVNYLRVGDIFIDLTTSGFPINLTNYKASVDPFYCRSDVLDWHSLILKIERHARRSVVRDGVAKSVSTIGNFFHLSSVTPATTVSTQRQGKQQHIASISTRSDVFNPLSVTPFTTSSSTLQNSTNTELNALALSYLNGSNIDRNTLIQQQQDILHQQECKENKKDEDDLKMMILLGVKPEVKKASGKKTSAGVGTSLLSRFSRS